MTVRHRRKFSRFRASHTHGWGSKKKHRGSGNRGGCGNAGSGKKCDSKKPSNWKEDYFGKHGFRMRGVVREVIPVNLKYFEAKIEQLVADKLATKQGDKYIIDAQKLGFNKVLGCGKVTKKYVITAEAFSSEAIEKIKGAGGDAILMGEETKPAKS